MYHIKKMDDIQSVSYIVVKPYQGLVNQLLSITWALEIGEKTGRYVKIESFQPNFNNYRYRIPISNVIDISETNQMLKNEDFKVRISNDKINSIEFDNVLKPRPALKFKTLEHAISTVLKSQHKTEFHVGYSFYAKSPFNIEFFKCIVFKTKFYSTVKEIRDYLELDKYDSIHMRIENDSIKHNVKKLKDKTEDDVRQLFLSKYEEIIINLRNNTKHNIVTNNRKIFVASNLLKCEDDCNQKYLELKQKYNLIDTSSCKEFYDKVGDGRELRAIIDFILCLQSENFYCLEGISSFSSLLSKLKQ